MEEFYYKHPLDKLLHNDNIYILESMIPYVDYEYKFPLVLLIKFFEIKKLHYYFSDKGKIKSCGLHSNNHDFSTMVKDFENSDYFPSSSPISQMLNIYKYMEMFKNMNSMMESMGMGNMGDMMSNMMSGNGSQDAMFNFMNSMNSSNTNNDFLSTMMNSFTGNNSTNNTIDPFTNNDIANAFNFSNNMPIHIPNDNNFETNNNPQSYTPPDDSHLIYYNSDSSSDINTSNDSSLEFDFDSFFEKYNQSNKESSNEQSKW